MEINKKILQEIIEEKEKGYINTLVNLFLYPRFVKLCEEEIENLENTGDRLNDLNVLKDKHMLAIKAENESKETWELLIPYLKSLLK